MDEHFLHYIWKNQKFNSSELRLTDGQPLNVFNQGFHNQDSGPDFEEGRIKIGEIEWAGSIEIHIHSSDWLKHNHQNDEAYGNVILHVVWSHDKEIETSGAVLPTLELKQLIDPAVLKKYKQHLASPKTILCESQIKDVPKIIYSSMLDRMVIQRLEEKASHILAALASSKNDWEEVTYRTLGRNFGFSTNKSAFIKLTQQLPFDILKKNLNDYTKTEALIFGQAGFLENAASEYQVALKKEYEFLKTKFKLKDSLSIAEWKFGKMRPGNFPTVRLAQLASLLHQNPNLFSTIVSIEHPKRLMMALEVKNSAYWQSHYDFGKPRKRPSNGPGPSSLENLVINSVSPILAAFSKYAGEQSHMDRAVSLLEGLKPEANRYTKQWNNLNLKARSAFESQAQIQLINEYCDQRKCLACNIGVHLLSK